MLLSNYLEGFEELEDKNLNKLNFLQKFKIQESILDNRKKTFLTETDVLEMENEEEISIT